jgi:hypothetical protein
LQPDVDLENTRPNDLSISGAGPVAALIPDPCF